MIHDKQWFPLWGHDLYNPHGENTLLGTDNDVHIRNDIINSDKGVHQVPINERRLIIESTE